MVSYGYDLFIFRYFPYSVTKPVDKCSDLSHHIVIIIIGYCRLFHLFRTCGLLIMYNMNVKNGNKKKQTDCLIIIGNCFKRHKTVSD